MEAQEIRSKLRPKDYQLITEKLKGLYAERTLKESVKNAALELIAMREKYVNA